jgi:hypothetical protein
MSSFLIIGVALGTTLDIIAASIFFGSLTAFFEKTLCVDIFQADLNFFPLNTPKAILVFPMSIVSSIILPL